MSRFGTRELTVEQMRGMDMGRRELAVRAPGDARPEARSEGRHTCWVAAVFVGFLFALGCGRTTAEVGVNGGAPDAGATYEGDVGSPSGATMGSVADGSLQVDASEDGNSGEALPSETSVAPDAGGAPVCSSGGGQGCDSVCGGGGLTSCGGSCVDTSSSASHCGGCGQACATSLAHAQPACVGGACTFSCEGTYSSCNGVCADESSDVANCGRCGNRCGSGQSCESGMCVCPGGMQTCGGTCVDPQSDPSHCGGCDTTCHIGCSAGQCIHATALAAGRFQTCALLSDGTVRCWGLVGPNDECTFGTPTLTPATVSGISGATAIAAGVQYQCAVVAGGTVMCWGCGTFGGFRTTQLPYPPVAVANVSGATAIGASDGGTCALISDGTVWCWGTLGVPSLTPSDVGVGLLPPAPVPGLSSVVAMSVGGQGICTVIADGTVECWGNNDAAGSRVPVRVAGLTDAVAVATTYTDTCALTSGGTVQCWGSGPLGDGTTNDSMTPVAISGLTGATAIATAAANFALMPQGTVEAWGRNYSGQLGNGTRSPSLSPVPVTGMVGATALAAGESHVCAAFPDGTVKCWGSNSRGQLGDGTTNDSATPVLVQW